METRIAIYSMSHPLTKQVFYVGKTINLSNRAKEHNYNTTSERMCNMIKSIKKLGMVPIFEELDYIVSDSYREVEALENYWIDQVRQWGFTLLNYSGNLARYKEIHGGSYWPLKTRAAWTKLPIEELLTEPQEA